MAVAEYMQNRLIYRVFHSRDEDAVEQLMATWSILFPDVDEETRASAVQQAQDTVAMVSDDGSYFTVSPGGRIEVVSAVDIVTSWETVEQGDLFARVSQERHRQVTKLGYTPEHDDAHGGDALLQIASGYLTDLPDGLTAADVSERVVKAMAVLVAAHDYIQRMETHVTDAELEALLRDEIDPE